MISIPRWTVYPALVLLLAMLWPAQPAPDDPMTLSGPATAAQPARESKHPRVVVLGIDGMDPDILGEVVAEFPDRMPNFRRLIDEGSGIQPLLTATPPQSPVAWSNFITGLNPGGHGIFDFIHRDPTTRSLASSTTRESSPTTSISLWGGWKLPTGGESVTNRTGASFWSLLKEAGIPADIWRMPINFPVEGALGWSFPGMMTPALDSAYGECTLFTTDPDRLASLDYEKVVSVSEFNGRIDTRIAGPPNPFKEGDPHTVAPLVVFVDREAGAVAIEISDQVIVLEPGEWSSFVQVSFEQIPGLVGMIPPLTPVGGITRFYLKSLEPEFEMYASPVNIDPEAPAIPVSEPSDASEKLAGKIGLYYTQGMAEDVNSLKNELLSDAQFMEQVDLVYGERRKMLDVALDRYTASDEGGFLFFYFSTVDLSCHMMWRHSDDEHPFHDEVIARADSSKWSGREGSTWRDVVKDLYMKMDPVLGYIRNRVGDDATCIVMSDHGFAPYHRKFSLNTWLLENGYLVLHEGHERELPETDPAHQEVYLFVPGVVDWSKTRAYGMGFNGLYLNLAGRELDNPDTDEDESGIVQPGQVDGLLAELKAKLEAEVDPKNGRRPVLRADLASEVYTGERLAEAPDILVGYDSGYGNSDEASSGRIPHQILSDNTGGTFNGSHLMAPDVVSGVLVSNRPVRGGDHALEDLTVEILARYGVQPGPGMDGQRVLED